MGKDKDTEKFTPFKIITSNQRIITPGGLALVGQILKRTSLRQALNKLSSLKRHAHMNYECVIAYMGLLCQGKTEYESMREMQEDPEYYSGALRLKSIPSTETMRQRLNEIGFELAATDVLMEESANLLKSCRIEPTPCFTGHVPLDVDVSPHDNSNTKKEGVSRAYNGIDGYAPIYAYIGEEGYIANTELRYGSAHSQNGTVEFNDSIDNIKLFNKEKVDFVIKRNLRKESIEDWLSLAREHGEASHPRDGKIVYTGSVLRDRGLENDLRIVYRVTERTVHVNGQIYLLPKIEVDTWWTSLENSEADIIRLYCEHATCEQFHSEIKSDIGLERFPSSHFDTNAGILKIAALAYNILRIIGQTSLKHDKKLSRREVSRIRVKTIIKNLVYIACHVVSHARQKFLNLGRSNIWRDVFISVYMAFA